MDAVAVTGQVLSALQTIVSRNVDPQETAVLTIGTVHGGTAFNVIAETVEMQGTIRTFSPAVRETVLTRLRVLLDGVTAGLGATYELDVQEMTGAVVNDAGVAEIARAAAVQVVGNTAVSWHAPPMVSEDFSEFARRVPAGVFHADRLRQRRAGLECTASQPALRLRRATRPAPRRGLAGHNGGALFGRDVRRLCRTDPGQFRVIFSLCILAGRL